MAPERTILLLQGDAEARLLADADVALEAVLGPGIRLVRAWAPRLDWLADGMVAPVEPGVPLQPVAGLLAAGHRMVILAALPSIACTSLRSADGTRLLAHQGLPAGLAGAGGPAGADDAPLAPSAVIAALEPQLEALLARGVAVAVCGGFRHVREPRRCRAGDGAVPLRDRIRELNLGLARLSQRTGCFVLDLDRPLAQEGGAPLECDCFGGDGRANEIALDELAALALDALPDEMAGLDAGAGLET